MAGHTLLSTLKERLGITTTDHDTKLNRYLSDEESLHGLSAENEAEAVVILLLAEADFYRFLAKNTAERIKYSEGNRSVDGTKSADYYLKLAQVTREEAQEALSVVEEGKGPAIIYPRAPEEEIPSGRTDDVKSPDYRSDT